MRKARPDSEPGSEPHLEPPFDQPVFARALQAAFAQATPRALSLPSALSPATSAALRAFARPRLTLFDLADRGRYRYVDLENSFPDLLEQLRQFSEQLSGRALNLGPARIIHFSRGDYALRLDDARSRSASDPVLLLEATLDLSRSPTEGAATVYSEGPWTHFPIAQLPGQLSLVERGPASTRCDRYRSCLTGPREFVLLRATFPLAES